MTPLLKIVLGFAAFWAAVFLVQHAITSVVLALQQRLGLIELTAARGRTTQSPQVSVTAALCVSLGGLLYVAAQRGYMQVSPGEEPWVIAVSLGLCGFGLMFFLFQFHRWRWDEDGIEWRGVWRSVRIRWKDIRSVRLKEWSHEFEIVGGAGERIVWTIFTIGVHALFDALLLYRPDLRSTVPMQKDDA